MQMVVLLKLHFVKFVIFLGNIIVLLRSLSRILVSKFESTGSVQNVPTPTRVRPGQRSKVINLTTFSTIGVIQKHSMANFAKGLALKPYQIQLVQELKLTNHSNRCRFAQNNLLTKHISFVNKQNCRIWASEYPKAIIEKPLHAQRVTVWCAMWSGGVIVRKTPAARSSHFFFFEGGKSSNDFSRLGRGERDQELLDERCAILRCCGCVWRPPIIFSGTHSLVNSTDGNGLS
uniref:SFRICE_005509 n=1 Tax=Spodoptera frugiperda TaxID=7108 RepID=A0A2H1VV93_SPOFR